MYIKIYKSLSYIKIYRERENEALRSSKLEQIVVSLESFIFTSNFLV